MRCCTRSRNRRLAFNLAPAAVRTFAISSGPNTSMWSDIAPSGFGTKSTAPRRRASRVTCAPSVESEDTITTGQGRSIMMRSRQASPSISGMLMSSVTTSGSKASNWAKRLAAVARKAHFHVGLAGEHPLESFRINAESSTTRTLITGPPGLGLGLEGVEQFMFGPREQLNRIQHEHDPRLLQRLMTPCTSRAMSSVRSGGGPIASPAQRSTSDTLSTISPARRRSVRTTMRRRPSPRARHVEPAPLVHDGQDLAPHIDDAFEEPGRLGDARDPVGNASDFLDRVDGQGKFVVAQPEDDELTFARRGRIRLRRRWVFDRTQPLHDVLPKELFGRKNRNEAPALLTAIDRLQPRLAARPRPNQRRNRLGQPPLGGDDRAGAIDDQSRPLPPTDMTRTFSRISVAAPARNRAIRASKGTGASAREKPSLRNRGIGAWRDRNGLGQRKIFCTAPRSNANSWPAISK